MNVTHRTYKQNKVMNDRSYNDHNMQLPAIEMKMREYKILRFTKSDVLFFCKAKGISPEYLIVELMKESNFY